jgi:hypothetical protein
MAYFKPDWKWTKKDGKKKERRPVVCYGTLYFVTTTVAFIGTDFEANFWDNIHIGPILGQFWAYFGSNLG